MTAEPVRSFEDFYRAEWASVRRAVGFTVGEPDLARECVDEAMTRAYERWHQVAAMDRPAAWVYRVAVNQARNRGRRRAVERRKQPPAPPAQNLDKANRTAARRNLSMPQGASAQCPVRAETTR